MAKKDKKDQYDTYYRTTVEEGAVAAGTDLIVLELEAESQLSYIKITGDDTQEYSVNTRNHDGSGATTVANYAGNANYEEGSFELPVHKAGTLREYVVQNETGLTSGNTYAINIRVDERNG